MTGYTVQLTRKADDDEAQIYAYITERFGLVYAENFRAGFIRFCHLLTRQPFMGRPAKNDASLRVFLFEKQNKVVYKVENNHIAVLRILNTRTNLSSKF